MFKLFRRGTRATTIATEPRVGERVETVSPADLKRAQQFADEFEVTGPFTNPDSDEHALWKAGKLVPYYLTRLLDAGGHVGPSVDAACLAKEPAVDRWELGAEYPGWEQTVALARLLDVRVRDLTHPDAGPSHREVRPRMRLPGLVILSFDPAAVEASTQMSS